MLGFNFINVEDVLVNRDVAETFFCCDISKCKGACCTIESEFGAPIKASEIKEIEKNLSIITAYLPEKNREEIEQKKFFETKDGELLIRSMNHKECVFVYYENNIAKCSIEKAFLNGEIDFRKPISCHLFPIRISDFGGDVVCYERLRDCSPALEEGMKKQITIAEFCKDSLERNYGKKWYANFMKTLKK